MGGSQILKPPRRVPCAGRPTAQQVRRAMRGGLGLRVGVFGSIQIHLRLDPQMPRHERRTKPWGNESMVADHASPAKTLSVRMLIESGSEKEGCPSTVHSGWGWEGEGGAQFPSDSKHARGEFERGEVLQGARMKHNPCTWKKTICTRMGLECASGIPPWLTTMRINHTACPSRNLTGIHAASFYPPPFAPDPPQAAYQAGRPRPLARNRSAIRAHPSSPTLWVSHRAPTCFPRPRPHPASHAPAQRELPRVAAPARTPTFRLKP